MTVLHFAAFNGNQDIINYALSLHADLFKPSKSGITLFHAAAQGDSPTILALLKMNYEKMTGRSGKEIGRFKDSFMSTPLHWACAKGSQDIL